MMSGSNVSGVREPAEAPSLIDLFLAEQRSVAPVIKFSRAHNGAGGASAGPPKSHEGRVPASRASTVYRDLLPLSRPVPGQQYAFEVDLDQCSGCKACVTACHNLNGLDDGETWRTVGTISGEFPAFQQAVTTACHHCADPGCLTGCPVNAYEKDSITGIVQHLDDQCIGCQYCVLMCPYDVPKYNDSKGIVRKCDMCSSRLSAGEAPACVQGCPNEAIRITVVHRDELITRYRPATGGASAGPPKSHEGRVPASRPSTDTGNFLPTSPNPAWTVPTTRYISARQWPTTTKVNAETLPSPSHLPLVLMLILTQASVGGFCWLAMVAHLQAPHTLLAIVSFAFGCAGLAVSIFHLGRPHLAWRAVLNLRTSWMSREIVLFGLFAVTAGLEVGVADGLRAALFRFLAALIGMFAVFSSVMIYEATHRIFWRVKATAARFFGTVMILGTSLALIATDGLNRPRLAVILFLATAC